MSEDTYGLDDIRFCFGEKVVADLRQQIIFEHYQKVRKMCEDRASDCYHNCNDMGGMFCYMRIFLYRREAWQDNQLKAFIEKVEGGE